VSRSIPGSTRRVEAIREDAQAGRYGSPTAWTRADMLVLALFALGAVWSYVSADVSGGDAAPVAMLFIVVGLVFGLARLVAVVSASVVPLIVVTAAVLLVATSPDEALNRFPLSGPFGYTNATGAFVTQAAIAALMLATVWRRGWAKAAAAGAAIVLAAVPFALGSRTPALLLLILPLVAFSVREANGPRAAVVGCAVLFAVTLATTGLLAARYSADDRSGIVDRVIRETLTERRVLLWHEAFVIMMQHPGSGVGAGRFAAVSPAAQQDRDTNRWAHHGFLQQGAEAGVPGFMILVLLFVYGFVRLRATSSLNPAAVPGAVALAALGINACIDYVLHFAAIPITAAALVGAATVVLSTRGREP
jgi:hypothetical protein